MTGDDELLQVEHVIARLIARYPSESPADIEHTVRTIHQRFANGKVRDFVPLLVEKAARRQIADRVTTQTARAERDDAASFDGLVS
ncbi:three-helix bundle dimerization domain-containing protein [Rhodococcus sp. NPDC055112]